MFNMNRAVNLVGFFSSKIIAGSQEERELMAKYN